MIEKITNILYVHRSTIRRILHLYNTAGDVAPKEYKCGQAQMLDETEKECIVLAVLSKPSMLRRILYAETGTSASISTICRTLSRLGFT